MINAIKEILDLLVNKIETWKVHVTKWLNDESTGCTVSFIKNQNRYRITIYDDRITLDVVDLTNECRQIGTDYMINIPIEEQQSINLQTEILLKECLDYTKSSFTSVLF